MPTLLVRVRCSCLCALLNGRFLRNEYVLRSRHPWMVRSALPTLCTLLFQGGVGASKDAKGATRFRLRAVILLGDV